MKKARRFMYIGAHPDDPDCDFGGTAIKLARAGHAVKFVSATNGNCGHHRMSSKALAARRRREARAAAKIAGICEYQVLDHSDCGIENTLEARAEFTRIIRGFAPDVVITHRTCDYHPDHRITAQIVLDCSFIVRVPLYCPDAPVPAQTPVFAFCYDAFTKPAPFRADAVSEIDSVLEGKLRMLDCHASQFYEWLPFNSFGIDRLDAKSMSWREKKELILKLLPINKTCAGLFRRQLARVYGAGKKIEHAEAFEASEYGRTVEPAQFQALFEP